MFERDAGNPSQAADEGFGEETRDLLCRLQRSSKSILAAAERLCDLVCRGRQPDTHWLDRIQIASPCNASWDDMEGDDQIRFCRHCHLNVYNFAWMSRREAAALVRGMEDRLCVRFYRRHDGTLLTSDCPVGVRTVRRWLLARMAAVVGLPGLLLGVVTEQHRRPVVGRTAPEPSISTRDPALHRPQPSQPPSPPEFLMGRIGTFHSELSNPETKHSKQPLRALRRQPPRAVEGSDRSH